MTTHDDSIPGKLDALTARVGKIEVAVAENTELTRDIKDLLTAGKVMSKIIKWMGGLAAAGSAIWAAFHLGSGGK